MRTIGFLIVILGTPLYAQVVQQKVSLIGVKQLYVLVENLHPDIEKDGLDRLQIQKDVEALIRSAGIPVSDPHETGFGVDPYLYININSLLVRKKTHHLYSISLNFKQFTRIINIERFSMATTWSESNLGVVPRKYVSDEMRRRIEVYVRLFIQDFNEANPVASAPAGESPDGEFLESNKIPKTVSPPVKKKSK